MTRVTYPIDISSFGRGITILVAAVILSACATQPTYSQRLGEFNAVDQRAMAERVSQSRRVSLLSQAYEKMFPVDDMLTSLDGLPSRDIESILAAAESMHFYSKDPAHATHVIALVEELDRRSEASATQHETRVRALIKQRRFDEAKSMANQHGLSMEVIPTAFDNLDSGHAASSVWRVDPKAEALTREAFSVSDQAASIVVVSHPLCPFSRNASAAIAADPELNGLFRQYSHWIVPQNDRLYLPEIRAWNAINPHAQTRIVHRQSDWLEIDGWGTPTFYFFKHGRLVSKVTGWPAGGRKAQLIAGLKAIGVVD